MSQRSYDNHPDHVAHPDGNPSGQHDNHRAAELDGVPLYNSNVERPRGLPPVAGDFIRPVRPQLCPVSRPLASHMRPNAAILRPSLDPANSKAPPSCASNASPYTNVKAPSPLPPPWPGSNLNPVTFAAQPPILPGNAPLPLPPPILPGTENPAVMRSAFGSDPLGVVPIPGMKPMTVPDLPPVPGMPKVPLALGVPILHGVSKMVGLDKWEEFEDLTYLLPYYYSRAKNISVWEEPAGATIIRTKKVHIGSVESWEVVVGATQPWVRVKTSTGLIYFHNKDTDELAWECPEEIVECVKALDERADEEFEVPEDSEPEFEIPDDDEEDSDGVDSDECPEMMEIRALRKKLEDFTELVREHKIVPSVRGAPAVPYERALPKLCNDPRFLDVAPGERRKLFDSTVKKLKELDAKDTTDRKQARMRHFRALLQEEEVQTLLWDEYHAPVATLVDHVGSILGHDARWTACEEKERKKLTSEAVEKVTAEVEKKKKAEREEFATKVDAYLARAKRRDDQLPRYNEAREYLLPVGTSYLTDIDRSRIYSRLLLQRRDIYNARMKRERDLNAAKADMETQRTKRARREEEDKLVKVFVEKCKNPWAPDVSWTDYVADNLDQLVDKTEDDLQRLWDEFKDKIVAMRQRLFLQELRRKFDREKVSVLKDLPAVVKELGNPILSCVPEKYLAGIMEEFNVEIIKDAKLAFEHYLTTCEHFAKVEALEEKGPVFEALMDKLCKHKLYQRLNSCPADRAEMVRAAVIRMKSVKTKSKIVLDE